MIVADAHAEVYETQGEISACLRNRRSRFRLGYTRQRAPEANCVDGGCEVTQVALAGNVVAYAATPPAYSPRIIVRSIANGAVLHEAPVVVATRQRVLVEEAIVHRLVVGPTGAAAWIQEDLYATHGGAVAPPIVFGVFGLGSDGSHAFALDLPVQPRSLRLTGDRLTWHEEGRPYSARLR